jgi:hypothetical protein
MPPKAARGGLKSKSDNTQSRDSSDRAEKKNTRKLPLRDRLVHDGVTNPSDNAAPEDNSAALILDGIANLSNAAASDDNEAAITKTTKSVSDRAEKSPPRDKSDNVGTIETALRTPAARALYNAYTGPGTQFDVLSEGTALTPKNPSATNKATPVSSLISSKESVTVVDANEESIVEANLQERKRRMLMEYMRTPQKINENNISNVSIDILPCKTYFTTKLTLRNTNLLHQSIFYFETETWHVAMTTATPNTFTPPLAQNSKLENNASGQHLSQRFQHIPLTDANFTFGKIRIRVG